MYDIPQHPQPSFFETTEAAIEYAGDPLVTRVVTHLDIEVILAQPQWDIRDMQAKVTANLILRGWLKNQDGVMVPPEKGKGSAFITKKAAPKKKPAKKAVPRKRS